MVGVDVGTFEHGRAATRSVTRDLNELERRGLIIRRGPQFMANY